MEEASLSVVDCAARTEDAETEAVEETTGIPMEVWPEEELAVATIAIAST